MHKYQLFCHFANFFVIFENDKKVGQLFDQNPTFWSFFEKVKKFFFLTPQGPRENVKKKKVNFFLVDHKDRLDIVV